MLTDRQTNKQANGTKNITCLFIQEMANVQTIEDAEEILLKHGENMTDMVGEELDRIEKKTKV